tara:strand:- start:220 stop:402 length:183 start_codon:yes stop_codon:yes gene_type:complete
LVSRKSKFIKVGKMVILSVISEVGTLALVSFGEVYGGPETSRGVVSFNPETKEWILIKKI